MAIKKLQNDYTTQEQSKRLLELGLPADSADLYSSLGFENLIWVRNTHSELREDFFDTLINGKSANTPIWSVGRLIEIYCILTNAKEFKMYTISTLVEEIIYLLNAIKINGADFSRLEE